MTVAKIFIFKTDTFNFILYPALFIIDNKLKAYNYFNTSQINNCDK